MRLRSRDRPVERRHEQVEVDGQGVHRDDLIDAGSDEARERATQAVGCGQPCVRALEPALDADGGPDIQFLLDDRRGAPRLQTERVADEIGALPVGRAPPRRHVKVGTTGRVCSIARERAALRKQFGGHAAYACAGSSSRPGRSATAATIYPAPMPAPEIDGLFRLDGRVAVVTGASRGLGERFVRILRSAGAEVIAAGRDAEALQRLAAETGAAIEVGDVRDDSHLERLVQHALARHGRLDVAVPNAGVSEVVPFEEQDMARLRELVEINLIAVLALAQLAGRAMLAQGGGSIVNVASILGLVAPGDTAMAGYTAAKAGVIGATRDLAAEWGRRGVRVNALCPGYFPTDMTEGLTHPGAIKRIERRTLLGRVPRTDELDGALLFLASDASSYMTGQTLVVDGGWTSW